MGCMRVLDLVVVDLAVEADDHRPYALVVRQRVPACMRRPRGVDMEIMWRPYGDDHRPYALVVRQRVPQPELDLPR